MLDSKLYTLCADAPDSNSSSALKCVGVSTGKVTPARGPEPITRWVRAVECVAATRFTGPRFCTSAVT